VRSCRVAWRTAPHRMGVASSPTKPVRFQGSAS
jgi:hypothetical protein